MIGRAAFELLDERARAVVLDLVGNPDDGDTAGALGEACNWPDTVRDESEWRWSSPLHYVNIPRHSEHYDHERDCREGLCVTEGILQFAQQLDWPELEPRKRRQAFAFVCHLVADLHQPLHAGFLDDRGGNTVEVSYHGEDWNLHQFWDGVVVRERMEDEDRMVADVANAGRAAARQDWNPEAVREWTDQSHALAVRHAYPDGPVIDDAFADRSWSICVDQWGKAAGRLAQVLNAVLGEGAIRERD